MLDCSWFSIDCQNIPTILPHWTGKRLRMSCAEITSVIFLEFHVISILIGSILLTRPMKLYITKRLLWFRCWRSGDLPKRVRSLELIKWFLIWFFINIWRITILKMEKQMSVLWIIWDLTKTNKSRTPAESPKYAWPETWAMTQALTKIVACLTKVRVPMTRGKPLSSVPCIGFYYLRLSLSAVWIWNRRLQVVSHILFLHTELILQDECKTTQYIIVADI